jgi:hypothetical protein
MPQDYALRMSEQQVDTVVDYLVAMGDRMAQEMREQGTPVATAVPAAEAATPVPQDPAGPGEETAGQTAVATLSDWTVLAIVLMVLGIFLALILVVLARRQDQERA